MNSKTPGTRAGVQYPLVPVLARCPVALLPGDTTRAAIPRFGRLRRHRPGHALGFQSGKMPAATTPSPLGRQPDAAHTDRLIRVRPTGRHADGREPIAPDGKTLRGSRDGDVPGTHVWAASVPRAAAAIARMRVGATTNEHQAGRRRPGVSPPPRGAVVAPTPCSRTATPARRY